MEASTTPPAITRPLGRSRSYTRTDLPARLQRWHAPRANRWEHLWVVAGPLDIEQLGANGVTAARLLDGDSCWMAPGTRWRVTQLDSQTCFQLAIHADDAAPISSPQVSRAAWLDYAERVELVDGEALARLLASLTVGEQRLARGRFAFSTPLREAMGDGDATLLWHLLDIGDGRFTAFIARAARPIGLLEYLGHDHAVIEATLPGALHGDPERIDWLHTALTRHLAIEEALLFPAYINAGGRVAWVRGLCNEHAHLRCHLGELSEPAARRKFLLLLDGHDEKEEQIVYPDILARLDTAAAALTRAVILYPSPLVSG